MVVSYGERALDGHVKRRIRLLSAGVVLRGDLAADTAWVDARGYTFVGRHSTDPETDIRSVRAKRHGIRVRDSGSGISRAGPATYRLSRDWRLVDVFDPRDHYVATAAAHHSVVGRRILQHLGETRRHCDACDRQFLTADEVEAWRELLPVVVQNHGYGFLYLRPAPGGGAARAEADSTRIMAERFDLEEVAGYTLVGKARGDQQYRHVFAPGGEYRLTAIQHRPPHRAGRDLLSHLGMLRDPRADSP